MKRSWSELTGIDLKESAWRVGIFAPLFLAAALNNLLAAFLYLVGVILGVLFWNHK